MKKVICIFTVFIVLLFYVCINNFNMNSKTIRYNGDRLLVSIDGNDSKSLPVSGNYYLVSYKCGSNDTSINWDNKNHKLSISNGNRSASVFCSLNFESKPLLSSVKVGSYVKYVGNNGCHGKSCQGENVNYINDDDMGYCGSSDNKYVTNGWRVAYVLDGSSYIVSSGALECVTKNGGIKNTLLYVNDLNVRALKYCNSNYVYGGKCVSSNVRAFNDDDYKYIVGKKINNCLNNKSDMSCGYNEDLIDNGGYYWISSIYESSSNSIFNWNALDRSISYANYNNNYGLRPIIRIDSSVYVSSGNGTYDDPYIISKS